MRFDTHYTSVPSCTPARAGILTGRTPWRHGQIGYGEIAPSYAPYAELVKMMVDAGYRTVAVGKNHFEQASHGFMETHIYDGEWERWGRVSGQRAQLTAAFGGILPPNTRS